MPAITVESTRGAYRFCIENLTSKDQMVSMKALCSLLSLVALGSVACSGGDAADPAPPGTVTDPNCEEQATVIDPTLLIDDMEDGDGLLAGVGIRNGGWWISGDGTSETTPPTDQAPAAERILGGRCGSEYAMRVTGSGFADWGAVMSATFRFTDDVAAYDATLYRGITFWARVGDDNESIIRTQIQDGNTHPNGGVCNAESGTPDECYNAFGTELTTISTEWQKFTLEFPSLAQRPGWGYMAEALDPAALYDLEWNFDPNRTFDFWVDDIWFYE